jgi:O-antigen ligase
MVLAGASLALAAAGLTLAVQHVPVSVPTALAGGVGLLVLVALVLARYDAAVALGFALLGIVRVEPSPPDAVFAMVIAVAIVTGRFRLERVPRTATALVGGLIALNLLSCIAVVDAPAGGRFLLITLYLLVFALWLAQYVGSSRQARLVLRAYLLIAVLSALMSVVALYVPFSGHSTFLDYGDTRARGLFKDANVYAPFLIPMLLVLFEELVNRRLLRMRSWLIWLCVCILVLGVLVAFSRAAWLNLAVASIVTLGVAVLRRRGGGRALRRGLLLLGSGAVVLTVVALAEPRSLGFLEERARAQPYDAARFAAQGEGIALGMSHPVGIGPGQFGAYSALATHSTYVRVFAEQGLLGLTLFAGLALMTLALALKNVGAGRDTYGIGSGALLGAWCGLLVNSVVVDTMHWRHMWVVAALIWAGAMSHARGPRPAHRAEPGDRTGTHPTASLRVRPWTPGD